MNDFNGAFAKVSPTETQNTIARIRSREAAHAAHSPFGGEDPEPLEKRVEHQFAENDRVVIHSPSHFHHGSRCKIIDARDATHMRVHLDNGAELTASHSDLIPEAAAQPESMSEKIAKRNPACADDGVLEKRARPKFAIGQAVVEKTGEKKTGTILDISPGGLIEIKFGPNLGGFYAPDSLEAA